MLLEDMQKESHPTAAAGGEIKMAKGSKRTTLKVTGNSSG